MSARVRYTWKARQHWDSSGRSRLELAHPGAFEESLGQVVRLDVDRETRVVRETSHGQRTESDNPGAELGTLLVRSPIVPVPLHGLSQRVVELSVVLPKKLMQQLDRGPDDL